MNARALAVLMMAVATCGNTAERSYKARKAFMLENPCPASGQISGECPGWVVDHIVPLCAGGRDEPWNLQWQTLEASKAKDRIERRECRAKH